MTECLCGCGEEVAPKRSFKSGHDQRLRSRLIREYMNGSHVADERLNELGWFGAVDPFVKARQKKVSALLRRADKDPREHQLGKNLKAGWVACCIYQLKNGGQIVDYVDKLGKTGRIHVKPKEPK